MGRPPTVVYISKLINLMLKRGRERTVYWDVLLIVVYINKPINLMLKRERQRAMYWNVLLTVVYISKLINLMLKLVSRFGLVVKR